MTTENQPGAQASNPNVAPASTDEAAADEQEAQTIDYGASQAEIDKAKQAAHDADRQRLAEESKSG